MMMMMVELVQQWQLDDGVIGLITWRSLVQDTDCGRSWSELAGSAVVDGGGGCAAGVCRDMQASDRTSSSSRSAGDAGAT